MKLDPANPLDVYFAFRLAFIDRPEIRIRTVEQTEGHDTRPGYDTGRFVTPGAPPVQVFLAEKIPGVPRMTSSRQVVRTAGITLEREALQTGDLRRGVHYRDPAEWASVVRAEYGDGTRQLRETAKRFGLSISSDFKNKPIGQHGYLGGPS